MFESYLTYFGPQWVGSEWLLVAILFYSELALIVTLWLTFKAFIKIKMYLKAKEMSDVR